MIEALELACLYFPGATIWLEADQFVKLSDDVRLDRYSPRYVDKNRSDRSVIMFYTPQGSVTVEARP